MFGNGTGFVFCVNCAQQLEGADGALIDELQAAFIALEQSHGGRGGHCLEGVGEGVWIWASGLECELFVERLGFHGEDAAETPLRGAHLLDDAQFYLVGLETVQVHLHEGVEFFGSFAVEEDTLAEQAVVESVLRGTLFPFGSGGSVGFGAVGAG